MHAPMAQRPRPAPPEEQRGMTFDEWVERNADRIWAVMRTGDIRDTSFNSVAEQLWSQL